MTAETSPHPGAVAYLDALSGDGWTVTVEPYDWAGEKCWRVILERDDVRQVTTAYSRAVAVEQAAWLHGARWD